MGFGRWRRIWPGVIALALACGLALAGGAAAFIPRDFDHPGSSDAQQKFQIFSVQRHDTPNDSKYDFAEPDDEDGPPGTSKTFVARQFVLGRVRLNEAEGPGGPRWLPRRPSGWRVSRSMRRRRP